MKKIVILLVSCLFLMSSCSFILIKYQNQETIGLNYNNAINYPGFWLTTDSICYTDGAVFPKCHIADKSSNRIIGLTHGGYVNAQKYEDQIYIGDSIGQIDENNRKYEIKCHDVVTNEDKSICEIINLDKYLVLDESVYYLEYTKRTGNYILKLKRFSMTSEEHTSISDNVISFGVIDNSVCYISLENDRMVVWKYDSEDDESVRCGDFSSEWFDSEHFIHLIVSYTPEYIMISWIDYGDIKISTIMRYSFEQNDVTSRTMEGYIANFVSYNENSYFSLSLENKNIIKIYKLVNKTDEITEITEVKGLVCDLFVGSDKGVYVKRYDDYSLDYFSDDGEKQDVFLFL